MAIVTSFLAHDFNTLARRALRQAKLCDVVEIRLDHIGHPGFDVLQAFFKECPKPVIVTVHGEEAHGSFTGSIDERLSILDDAAKAGARFVDIDYQLALDLGDVEAPCHRIVSRHTIEGTPEDLETWDEEVRAVLDEGDAIKLVPHARTTEDGMRLLRHLRKARGGLIAFCSGQAGTFTRVLAPIFGSPFTYAAAADVPGEDSLEPTAPGQLRLNELLAAMPPGGISHETAVLGVVGNPIGASASPFVHGMALKHSHMDAVYVPFQPSDLGEFLDLADDPVFRGLSVTAPFKRAAHGRSRELSSAAKASGSVNTLVRAPDGSWSGHDTDQSAVRDALRAALGHHIKGPRVGGFEDQRALVLGTGGAARAVLAALTDLGLRRAVAGRDESAAQDLAREFQAEPLGWDAIPKYDYDVLLHCTPVGSEGRDDEMPPIPVDWIREGTLVFDAVYRPIKTRLLQAAGRRGCTCVPGAEWFVRQATEQFKLFTQLDPDDGLMRKALENVLTGNAPAGIGG
jgi:3-dehydroquinate dehydratase / shikimate dehydrogenase